MSPSLKQIVMGNLNYRLTADFAIFKNINLSFNQQKYGVIGKNGIGKTTLLQLIKGEIHPSSGSVQVAGKVAYFPQNISNAMTTNIAQLLGIETKLQALKRVMSGSTDPQDYEIIGDHWSVEQEAYHHLAQFGLPNLDLAQSVASLSGGEKTLLFLSLAFFLQADFTLLDEPTNNLDVCNREKLYEIIHHWPRGLIIASHDRKLLNLMDKIVEISKLGIQIYGGNYTAYKGQKSVELQAAHQALETSKQLLKKANASIQERRERHQRAQAKGKKAKKQQILAKGQHSDYCASESQQRSENTQRRLKLQASRKLDWIHNDVSNLKAKIHIEKKMSLSLPETQVAADKKILQIKNLTFGYQADTSPIINRFNMEIQGSQRIAFSGGNGSGKTTLLQLIAGQLSPWGGFIEKIPQLAYLDQQIQLLNPALTILENFLSLNPDIKELDARYHLAHFLFRNQTALKQVKDLSSGERLRAALACLLMASKPPQLLLLDEPSNYLDLDSLASIEEALLNYQGTILLVSHDSAFIDNVGIEQVVYAPFNAESYPEDIRQ